MARGAVTSMQVVGKSWLTPHLVRLELRGPGGRALRTFPMREFADAYVKLELPPRGVDLPWPYQLDYLRATRPSEEWPVLRTYTVRDFDGERLLIDVVVHGDDGVAGPWARDVEPGGVGSLVVVRGPGGAYLPDLDADHHLMVGDMSALPAIAVALERLGTGARADIVIEVPDERDELDLPTAASTRLRWIHTACSPLGPGEELVAAVRALELPDCDVQAFVHGEASWVRELRSHLRFERGIPRERLSVSGYWRAGAADEQWRARKRAWVASVEAEERERGDPRLRSA